MKRAALWLMVLFALPASAQRVRFALHPVNAPSIEDAALVRYLDNEANNLLAGTRRFTLVNADEIRTQLTDDRGRCPARADERIRCLERLALTTRAVYALEIEVTRLGKTYDLSATIAAANRTVLKQPEPVSTQVTEKSKTKEQLRDKLIELLMGKLKIQELSLDPKDETPVAVVPPPPLPKVDPTPVTPRVEPVVTVPPTMIIERESSGAGLRTGAWVTGGIAVALGVTALAVGLSSNSEAGKISAAHSGEQKPYVLLDADEVATANTLRTKLTVTLICGVAAGVAALTSVVLFVVSGKKSQSALSLVPTVSDGSAGVVLLGRF